MATAIDKNENILKFGYSFKNPGPRNKADRAIIRHNEACMYFVCSEVYFIFFYYLETFDWFNLEINKRGIQ